MRHIRRAGGALLAAGLGFAVLPGAVQARSTAFVDSETALDEPAEAGLKVFCTKPDFGATCSERCTAKGIACVPVSAHPYKPDAGVGRLFSCNDLLVGFMCGYHYPNGDDCYFPMGTPLPKVCSYSGND